MHQEFEAQEVPPKHRAVKCPICKTIQSMHVFKKAGLDEDHIEKVFGFSCIGRFTNSGPHKQEYAPGRGCDWTLGGLFQLHELEIVTPDNAIHRLFEIASKDEAKLLMESQTQGAV